ncbi:SDR family NAD(P)-dependent oxidoreductase [Paenibacillus alvei]|uniref:SDR family NAD(P)-dependent oxidoreductase n=1 Tax=Paenibacillus alvei TaxID=44250 RepID=UPI0003865825|nr:SDR family NAD(P)-dependent oxidoreductase [Paenibacillus alvei]EPY14025.1 beta-ketoacyl synthase [Paenibacillus alvei A6-6i-x]
MNANILNKNRLRLKPQQELDKTEVKEISNQEIAIIGIHTNFPMSKDIDSFWDNMLNGVSCVSTFPENRSDDADRFIRFSNRYGDPVPYTKGSFLENIDEFDYSFFNISPKEALLMNPRQRLFLQAAWSVIEDAGYSPKAMAGSNVGVYVGHISDVEGYLYREMIREIDSSLLPASLPGNLSSIIPSRISYMLNLKGPSMTVDTACSSSLVAVDLACNAIRRGDCDSAIVGAVRVNLLPQDKEHYKLGIESSDDETRAFDDFADGSGMGEGVAAVLLKPLQKAKRDGDHIYCVIKGSASNQDGASMGITAPNPSAQTDVLIKAWNDAGIHPNTLSYIESHGTGTKLGDPIEIEGITKAFRKFTDKKQFCAIGSVKTNMGHLYDCAGLAGLIKAALALKHRLIPPNLHFNIPNKRIAFLDSPVYVNTHPIKWDSHNEPRRCGISSFGLSGTNCHVVLEEYSDSTRYIQKETQEYDYLFPLSAKSKGSLLRLIERYLNFLHNDVGEWIDICYTLSAGRDHNPYRIAIIAKNVEDCKKKLEEVLISQLNCNSQSWFSYGVVNELESEIDLTETVNQQIFSLQTCKESDRAGQLAALASMYIRGAEVNWDILYRNQKVRRVSLPSYPFERNRCWLEIPESQPERPDLFYEMEWFQDQVQQHTNSLTGETILILGTWDALTERLREEGANCIQVIPGDEYQIVSDRTYVIGKREEDYANFIQHVVQSEIHITKVIHLFTLNRNRLITNLDELDEVQNDGVRSLFHLTKALLNSRMNHKLEIFIVSDYVNKVTGKEKYIKPENAPLFGLGKVIGIEYPHLQCRAIDLDESASVHDLLSEIKTNRYTYQIALRNGIRFAEMMTESRIEAANERDVSIKEDGVYVITGGTGKLGLQMAKHLASKGKINLALINRSCFPDPSLWNGLFAQKKDAPLSEKIELLTEIQSRGAHVECLALDIASMIEVSHTFERLRQKYGRINGIIHAAGVAGRGFLIGKNQTVFDEVLHAKVYGTWVLDKVTEKDNLDFFVLFSSGVALSGELGQGDYTAANCYLDAYAEHRSLIGKSTLSINWVVWKGARMEEGNSAAIDSIFKAIPIHQALQAFDKVLNKDISRVLIGELNPAPTENLELFSNKVFHLSDRIQNVLNRSEGKLREISPMATSKPDIKLTGNEAGDYTDIEKKLALLYREVLGYNELNTNDSFFELGGDSVQLHRLHKLMEQEYPGRVAIADLFTYSSISRLAAFIKQNQNVAVKRNLKESTSMMNSDHEIAIIGMAGQFPGATNIDEYWTNIRNGIDCIRKIPESRREYLEQYIAITNGNQDKTASYMECGYLEGIENFDSRFFRISPKEADLTDPAQRLFMQVAWNALEDAGYGGEKIRGSRTGVYVGYANVIRDSYQKMLTDVDPVLMSESIVGNVSAMIPARISHMLDLKGPNMVVDTACSSSLTAVHVASNAIKNGDCEIALVGGIKLFLIPVENELFKIGIESSDGMTRAFDANSDGSGSGEGTAVIVLKELRKAKADGDRIHAVIKGSALNQDGTSMGITAPNPQAQTDVIVQAWERAGIHPESLAFLEAHGTATDLGDPIEINGIQNAFAAYTDKRQICAIGSVKSNIGHLNEAAGMASLIKAVMSLKNREIAPTLYFHNPNPKIDFYNSPLFINTHLKKWDHEEPMRCAVSSFGLSGTNCHMVLEEYGEVIGERADDHTQILAISAVSSASLRKLLLNYSEHFSKQSIGCLQDICYTANTGRGHFSYRLALIVTDKEDIKNKLDLLVKQDSYENLETSGIFYGYHKVKSDVIKNNKQGNVTESEIRQSSKDAQSVISSFPGPQMTHTHLEQLCTLYVQGAEILWEDLYAREEVSITDLPIYPFDSSKCWFQIPATRMASNREDTNPTTYKMGWRLSERKDVLKSSKTSGAVVILTNDGEWSKQLIERIELSGKVVLKIPVFRKNMPLAYDEHAYLHDMEGLLTGFHASGISQIIHCGSLMMGKVATLNDLEVSQQQGSLSLFLLMKAWLKSGFEHDVEVVLVSEYVYTVTGKELKCRPENAPLFGLGKALSKEHPNVKCRIIDIDESTGIENLLDEMNEGNDSNVVALRNGQRYEPTFEEYFLDSSEQEYCSVQPGGVYIITGGTGSIGLDTANLLATKGRIKLVLVNRSLFPDRELWDSIMASGVDTKLCDKIRMIRLIESKGSDVILYRTDISKVDQLTIMLNEIRSQFGEIKGIVHGAGLTKVEPLTEKSIDTFQEVMSSKVYGTWLLDHMTSTDKLDFFLMYSSIATWFETGFQSDYIAANAYIDSYSAMSSPDGRKRMVINWTTWKDKGMASDNRFQIDTIFKAIRSTKAIEILEQVWNQPINQLLIGEINYESSMALWLNNYSYHLSEQIVQKLSCVQHRMNSEREDARENSIINRVNLIGSHSDISGQTAQTIAEICREVLGFMDIDIHESFFEMGADSLHMKQFFQKLNKYYPGKALITDLFEYPTIYKLSQYIDQQMQTIYPSTVSVSRKDSDSIGNRDEELNRMFDELDNGNMSIDQVIDNLGTKKR